MSYNVPSDKFTSSTLVYKLCYHLTKYPPESLTNSYQYALQLLGSTPVFSENNEFRIADKIKKKLIKEGRQKEAALFCEYHRKLQTSAVLKNRCAVLYLLSTLYTSANEPSKTNYFTPGIKRILTSTPTTITNLDVINARVNSHSKGMSSEEIISTINSSKDYHSVYHNIQQKENGGKKKINVGIGEDSGDGMYRNCNRVAHVAAMFSTKEKQQLVTWSSVKREKSSVNSPKHKSKENEVAFNEVSDKQLLQEILYAAQGISGKVINVETRGTLHVDIKISLSAPVRRLVLRYSELGWMYCKIDRFCKTQSLEKSLGLVGQSFVAALQQELAEYYHLLAVLQSQLQQEVCTNGSTGLSLHRLLLWFMEPHVHIKVLASIVDACKGKKGGALATALYSFLQYGDPNIQKLVRHLLCVVVLPIYRILTYWMFCGELEDSCSEFFVAANELIPDISLWHEKYSLHKPMIPSFLTMDQAKKILSTGKAINYLRHVCQDHTSLKGREVYKEALDSTTVESLFSQEKDNKFPNLLEMTYIKTSKHVLSVLHAEYKLMDHLQAMRHYLLLGQGDFIRHLMDLSEPELSKPAHELFSHNLSGLLESAIRATNAQFDDPDILQRLDVRLSAISPGDRGWDVFSLDYHVDGPIGTVFTPQCMTLYLRLFNALWRAKRMEYVLSGTWEGQTTYARLQKQIPEMIPVSYNCHIILSEMVHFVQQMQYYVAFEVMECSWAELLQKINIAQDLDQVIAAHEEFLDTLLTRTLLDEESKDLLTQLRTIYDLIIKFQNVQVEFWRQAEGLSKIESQKEKAVLAKTEDGSWGITEQKELKIREQRETFIKGVIPATKAKLNILKHSYEEMVQKFLLMLTDHDDPNLRFLSFRLDFNEHYKSRNSRLQTSLTYQHRRKSLK